MENRAIRSFLLQGCPLKSFIAFTPLQKNKTAHNLIAELIAFDFQFILFVGSVGFNGLLEFFIPTSGIAILGRRYV